MPRLPEPTLVLKVENGRILDPIPTNPYLEGIKPVSYRPVPVRTLRTVPVAGAGARVPAGYVDAARAAAILGVPELLVTLRAERQPHLLPEHVVVAGQPWFDPATLRAVGA